ncbi:hypothetical protein LCGC14_2423170 [marine sediment metagenome]|uniref:Uncharacterized protein n=1 Tax=marine sediment metagenome TaxID=412755 RepID=A0A0F9E152_9ZZZZ
MTKDEIIAGIDEQLASLERLRNFLESLRPEELLIQTFVHGVMGFLVTAVDYLQVNLVEIKNKVRMS